MISEESCDTKTGLMAAENADFPVQIFHSITIFTVANGLFHSIIGLTVVEWERWNKKKSSQKLLWTAAYMGCSLPHALLSAVRTSKCADRGNPAALLSQLGLLSARLQCPPDLPCGTEAFFDNISKFFILPLFLIHRACFFIYLFFF